MPYQPYYPGGWQPGPSGNTPLTADALNHMESQYDAVMAETTSPGGTEPNRLAVTDGGGAVGRAREASDAIRVQGGVPFATTPDLSDIGLHQFSNSPGTGGAWVTIASVINSGVLLGGTVAGPDGKELRVRITVDGVATVINAVSDRRDLSSETPNYRRSFVVLPPIVFGSSLKIEWSTSDSDSRYLFGGMVWIREG